MRGSRSPRYGSLLEGQGPLCTIDLGYRGPKLKREENRPCRERVSQV